MQGAYKLLAANSDPYIANLIHAIEKMGLVELSSVPKKMDVDA